MNVPWERGKKMAEAKTLQKTLTRTSPKADLYVDLAEAATGIILVGFLWMHMLFVSTIILGQQTYDSLAAVLDKYYLAHFGIPFIIVVFLVHIAIAGRRAPLRLRDLQITWRLARMIGHGDTWIWVGQVITAFVIGILGSIHMWTVTAAWPITAAKSIMRVDSLYLWFYVLLLLVGEYHAGFGLYRIFVKWGIIKNRHTAGYVLKAITVAIVVLGLGALYTFKKLGGAA
jgi:fumarate reductase subunit C